jgi:hypothetical protein
VTVRVLESNGYGVREAGAPRVELSPAFVCVIVSARICRDYEKKKKKQKTKNNGFGSSGESDRECADSVRQLTTDK